MTPIEAVRLYKNAVDLYDSIPDDEPTSRDAIGSFRSDIHQLLMDTFRANGIEFQSRGEAAQIAFTMVRENQDGSTGEVRVSESEDLKNCPCCGKLEPVQWYSMTNEGPWALWCYTEDGGCGIGTNRHDTKAEAIACWNRRASDHVTSAIERTKAWMNLNETWENALDGLSGIDLAEHILLHLQREIENGERK